MPATILLDGYLSTLPAMSGHARTAARDAALALVAGALCADVDIGTQHATPALRAAMDAWIERHLRDRDLSPNSVAAAHAVSVRTVYRLFSQDGDTFGAVVRQWRLDHARQDRRQQRRNSIVHRRSVGLRRRQPPLPELQIRLRNVATRLPCSPHGSRTA
jgi:AraC-like DNA-binding protein